MCIFFYITKEKFQNFKINNIILESKRWVTNTLPCWSVTLSVAENSVSVHMTVHRYKSVNSLVSVNAAVVTARSSVKRQIPPVYQDSVLFYGGEAYGTLWNCSYVWTADLTHRWAIPGKQSPWNWIFLFPFVPKVCT